MPVAVAWGIASLFLHQLVAHGANLQERLGFLVKALALIGIEDCLANDAENCFWPEIVLVVEAVYRFQDFVSRQTRILNVGELVTAFIDHTALGQEIVLDGKVVELGAWVRVRNGNL